MTCKTSAIAIFFSLTMFTLVGCGGGGGGGAVTPPGETTAIAPVPPARQPPPTLVQNTFPTGIRTSISPNIFVLTDGDSAIYKKLDLSGVEVGTVSRVASAAYNDTRSFLVTETDGAAKDFTNYTKGLDGLTINFSNDSSLPYAIRNVLGTLLEYPDPVYPIDSVRIAFREGSLGTDLNGDGVNEGFQFRYEQMFRGSETLTFAGKSISTLHFKNTITLTLTSSNTNDAPYSSVSSEDTYFAEGFGMVKTVRSAFDSEGSILEPLNTLVLGTATIAGKDWNDYLADWKSIAISLEHNELIYVATHGKYYATVPTSANVSPNSIASIDPVIGSVTYTPIAGDPYAIAASADGSYLYVSLRSTGDVVKLSLPSLTELGRVGLGYRDQYNLLYDIPGKLFVSPTDPNLVVASLAEDQSFNRIASSTRMRLATIKNLVVVSRLPEYLNFQNLAFSTDGTTLFAGVYDFYARSYLIFYKYLLYSDGFMFRSGGTAFLPSQLPNARIPLDTYYVDGLIIADTAILSLDFRIVDLLPARRCGASKNSISICLENSKFSTDVATTMATVNLNTLKINSLIKIGEAIDFNAAQITGPTNQVAFSSQSSFNANWGVVRLTTSPLLP